MALTTWQRLWLKLAVVVAVFVAGIIAVVASGLDWSHWTPAALRAEILAWGYWAPIAFIVGYNVRVFLLVPASVMTLVAGVIFGPWWGTLYTLIASTMCALWEFGVARWVGREAVERWLAGRARLASFDAFIAERGFWAVLIVRLLPSLPFELMNISLGLSPVRWRQFMPATVLAMTPWTIAFCFLGEAMTDFRNVWKVLFGILAVVLITWAPWLWRHRSRKPSSNV